MQELRTLHKTRKDINAAHVFIRDLKQRSNEVYGFVTAIQEKLVKLHGKDGYIEIKKERVE